MRSTTTIATVLAAALLMSLCAAQVSIPLQKRNIQTDATGYAQETFYTLDLEVLGENPQKLASVIDLQQVNNFVADSTCPNCLSATSNKSDYFSCGNSCGTEVSDDPAVKLVGGKLRVNKHNTINRDALIGEQKVTLKSLVDATSLKDGNFVATEKLYLEQVKAGLGFGADTGKDVNSSVSQILAANNASPREFSLYFNSEMGRLIIGKPEAFFGQGGRAFKAITDETDQTTSWTLKVAPTLKAGVAPLISTQSEETPSSESDQLSQASLDSTTKFVVVPQTVFDRLDRSLFQHNNCAEGTTRSSICDCSGSWVPIEISLIVDYTVKSIDKNLETFTLEPANYLEEITSGDNSGKCQLLIKPKDSVTDQDFTLGTSFLSRYYANFNLDEETVTLSESKGIVPNALHIDNNYRLPFVIAGSILALALVGGLLLLLKSTKAPSDAEVLNASHLGKSRVQPSPATTISYLVRSPRQIESLQQISQYVKVQGPGGSPIHARVINSPQRNLIYSQAQPQVQQYYQQ